MFSYASNICISHPNHLSTRAALASRTPGLLSSSTKYLNSISVRELPLPAPQLLSEQESRLEGGRNIISGTTLRCEARSRVVHDRLRGYTYSFHPARVVHMYPLAPTLANKQLRQTSRHRSIATKLTATTTTLPSQSRVHPPTRGRLGL